MTCRCGSVAVVSGEEGSAAAVLACRWAAAEDASDAAG
jgi:hypothetical protein